VFSIVPFLTSLVTLGEFTCVCNISEHVNTFTYYLNTLLALLWC